MNLSCSCVNCVILMFTDWGVCVCVCVRFSSVAYLQQIWWVELAGEIEFQFPPGNYSLFFRLQLGRTLKRFGRRVCGLDRVHGWDIKPVRFHLLTSDGQEATSECYLHSPGNWVHYHAGDFVVEDPNKPIVVKFSMVQIDCTHTKGGLCVDFVLIRRTKRATQLKT